MRATYEPGGGATNKTVRAARRKGTIFFQPYPISTDAPCAQIEIDGGAIS
jgi:hypothetical protein